MPPTAHFQNLPDIVCQYLAQAHRRIQIAVCWFSHRKIFELLLQKLRDEVAVELILEYDSQNISAHGLNFSKFIKLGGRLYAYRDSALMHHKFALIDEHLLLTGSFNWTYNSNAENIIAIETPELLAAFRDEFNRLKAQCVSVWKINPASVKAFASYPLFQHTHFQLSYLRKRISSGTAVWWVRLDRNWEEHFHTHRMPFDASGVLRTYWTIWRRWDPELFDDWWLENKTHVKPAVGRILRTLTRRMQIGDLVLAVTNRPKQLVGLGVIQSEPKPTADDQFAAYREVQWIRTFVEAPKCLPKSIGQTGRYRGSALQLLQEIYS